MVELEGGPDNETVGFTLNDFTPPCALAVFE